MRKRSDRMIAGVASGVAHYLAIDPTIVRLIFVLLALSGPAGLIYLLLWAVMPQEPAAGQGAAQPGDQVFVATGETQRLRLDPRLDDAGQEIPIHNLRNDEPPTADKSGSGKLLGFILLGLGSFITLQLIWPGFASLLFPAALIIAGIWLLRRG